MKKAALVSMLFIISSVCVLFGEEYDFRKTRWGMNVKEVRESEKATLIDKQGGKKEYSLVYSDTIAGLKAVVEYGFTQYKLRSARYRFVIQTGTDALKRYRNFKEVLSQKYGQPESSARRYSEEKKKTLGPFAFLLLMPVDFRLGESIEKGQLVLQTDWATDFTYITLTLKGDAGKEQVRYILEIDYAHKRWADEIRLEEEEKQAVEKKELFDAL
ncbi:MAG: hypothetical protein JXQ30_11045 [Spirochaetes bacterium]|nr:hypothetical protein [Spirochaetota bacterium]